MKLLGFAAKACALWLVLMIGQVAGGVLFFHGAPAIAKDGPLDAGQAVLVINVVDALMLAVLAEAGRLRGWTLGLALGAVFFGLECGLSAIETVVFGADVRLPAGLVLGNLGLGVLRSLLVGAAMALLWRKGAHGEAPKLSGLVWKVPLIAALYIVCYFTAGAQIAMKFAAVRAYYTHLGQISFGYLLAVQFGRGLIWCGLAWLLARSLSGPAWRTALLTGLAFFLLMDLPLLFPNPFMLWPVRAAHFVEIFASNLVFGVLASLILLAGAGRAAENARPAASAA